MHKIKKIQIKINTILDSKKIENRKKKEKIVSKRNQAKVKEKKKKKKSQIINIIKNILNF